MDECGRALQALQRVMIPVSTDSIPVDVYAGVQALTCARKVRIWALLTMCNDKVGNFVMVKK